MSEKEIYPTTEEYATPPDLSLSETLILENELGAVRGLLVKMWSILDNSVGKVDRTHSRTAVSNDLLEMAKMADYAAGCLRMLGGNFPRPGAAVNAPAVRQQIEAKLYAKSAAPEVVSAAIPTIIYNNTVAKIENAKIVDKDTGHWYADLYGVIAMPASEVKGHAS